VAEDPARPDLLFAGTEFGLFATLDGGKRWVQLKGGLPTIAVRDIAIQEREGDLVIATFGRGFYVLDDLTALRQTTADRLQQAAVLFPVRPAQMFIPSQPLGLRDKAFQGASYFTAPNPPFGAVFTYYLKDEIKTRKKTRQETEKKSAEKGGDVAYPTWEDLKAEEREEEPAILLTVSDGNGQLVRRLAGPVTAGFHRVAWDLRFPPAEPTQLKPGELDIFSDPPAGPMAMPGRYTVQLARRVDGVVTPLGEPQPFDARSLGAEGLAPADRAALLAFQQKVARLQRAALGAAETVKEVQARIDHLKKALDDTPAADLALGQALVGIQARLKDLDGALHGDPVKQKRSEPTLPGIVDRVQTVVGGFWSLTSGATGTQQQGYAVAAEQFQDVLARLRTLVETDLRVLEERAEAAGAPWTPGRLPTWRP
jgi:hypothetical protein